MQTCSTLCKKTYIYVRSVKRNECIFWKQARQVVSHSAISTHAEFSILPPHSYQVESRLALLRKFPVTTKVHTHH